MAQRGRVPREEDPFIRFTLQQPTSQQPAVPPEEDPFRQFTEAAEVQTPTPQTPTPPLSRAQRRRQGRRRQLGQTDLPGGPKDIARMEAEQQSDFEGTEGYWQDVARNLLPSMVKLGIDTGTAMTVDLPDTIKGLFNLGAGAASYLIPGEQKEQVIRDLAAELKERYNPASGGLQRGFRGDPASYIADAATLLTGGAGAVRGARTVRRVATGERPPSVPETPGRVARAGQIANLPAHAWRLMQDAGTRATRRGGRAIAATLGAATEAGARPIQSVYRAGRAGGDRAAAARAAMTRTAPLDEIVNKARDAVEAAEKRVDSALEGESLQLRYPVRRSPTDDVAYGWVGPAPTVGSGGMRQRFNEAAATAAARLGASVPRTDPRFQQAVADILREGVESVVDPLVRDQTGQAVGVETARRAGRAASQQAQNVSSGLLAPAVRRAWDATRESAGALGGLITPIRHRFGLHRRGYYDGPRLRETGPGGREVRRRLTGPQLRQFDRRELQRMGQIPLDGEKLRGFITGRYLQTVTRTSGEVGGKRAVTAAIKEFMDDPKQPFTIGQADAMINFLRTRQGNMRRGTTNWRYLDRVVDAIEDTILNSSDEARDLYGRLIQSRKDRKRGVQDVKTALGLRETTMPTVALRKMQDAWFDPSSSGRLREQYTRSLDPTGKLNMEETLAGMALDSYFPKSEARRMLAAGAGGALGYINPALLPAIAATSPRITGELALAAGRVAGSPMVRAWRDPRLALPAYQLNRSQEAREARVDRIEEERRQFIRALQRQLAREQNEQ